jgi:hypothetical protein
MKKYEVDRHPGQSLDTGISPGVISPVHIPYKFPFLAERFMCGRRNTHWT